MNYNTKRGRDEERHMDWSIASTKAVVCLRRFRSTNDRKWLDLTEEHLKTANGLLSELDRVRDFVADPVEWIGAERVG